MRCIARYLSALGLIVLGGIGATVTTAQDEAPPAPRPPTVEVELTPATATVGDRVTAVLTVRWPEGSLATAPRFPAWQESWGKAEVLEVGEVEAAREASGEIFYRQQVGLTAFETGELSLPALEIAVPTASETFEITTPDDLVLEIRSVLPAEEATEAAEPRPAAAPRRFPASHAFLWTAAGLVVLCGLAVRRLLRNAVAAGPAAGRAPLLPPLEELLEGLGRTPLDQGEPAHTHMSLALRRFLGRSLGVPAPESTSSEIQRQLRQTSLPVAIAQQTVGLLRDCDGVKFARLEVASAITAERLQQVRQLAGEIDARLRPTEPAESAEGGRA